MHKWYPVQIVQELLGQHWLDIPVPYPTIRPTLLQKQGLKIYGWRYCGWTLTPRQRVKVSAEYFGKTLLIHLLQVIPINGHQGALVQPINMILITALIIV